MRWYQLNGYEFEQIPGDNEGRVKPGALQSIGLQKILQDLVTKQQHIF